MTLDKLSGSTSSEPLIFTEGYLHNEKLKKEGVSHRISELDAEEKKQGLNFKSEGSPTISHNDLGGSKEFVVHSKPAWYTSDGKDYKMIDLVVRGRGGESEEEVLERFNAQVQLAKEYGNMAREYIKSEVLPTLLDIKNVSCVLGRGDIYDADRVSTVDYEHPSDIDLILFSEGDTDAQEILEKFVEDHPEVVVTYHQYKVGKHGFEGKQLAISSHKTEDPIIISIDVIPLDKLLHLVENSSAGDLEHLLSPYALRTLEPRGSVVLNEDGTGKFERLKRVVNAVTSRSVTS